MTGSHLADRNDVLLDELATLIARRGIEAFVAAPLLQADDRFFPDEWHANDASVARLARRLLAYADLAAYEVAVELVADADDDELPPVAVWFAGVDGTTCRFQTALRRLDDPLLVVATVAHEVARAYRVIHGLDEGEEVDEGCAEELVSLTTVYLGFGVLTTNASYRYRATGEMRGSVAYTEWSHTQFGALPPDAMSFLLASQLTARDASSSELRAVVSQLEPNQRAFFEDAYRELITDQITARLRLPDRATWPAPRPIPPAHAGQLVRSLLGSLASPGPSIPDAAVVRGGRARPNAGRATFRVLGTASAAWFGLGMLASMALVIATAVIMGRIVEGPPLANFPVLALLGMAIVPPVVGFALGSRQRRDVCSDPDCNAGIPLDLIRCPGCGGEIAGTLKSRNERLDAEERLNANRHDYEVDTSTSDAP